MKSRATAVFSILVLVSFYLYSCSPQQNEKTIDVPDILYSFFVAGHVYGKPTYLYLSNEEYTGGVHPPFKNKFPYLKSYQNMQFGILAGDIVKASTPHYWDIVDSELAELEMPVYFAAGNHDVTNRELYEQRYGSTFFSFLHQEDLFIILDPNLDNWNISGDQLVFLKTCLTENSTANNVFIFFHQLLWWEQSNKYRWVEPNSFDGKAENTNFWLEIEPILRTLHNEVYLFAGDVGAHPSGEFFMYDHYANMHLIATGMGGGIQDNFIICNIHADRSVSFKLVSLIDESEDALGKLEDYRLTTAWSRFWKRIFN